MSTLKSGEVHQEFQMSTEIGMLYCINHSSKTIFDSFGDKILCHPNIMFCLLICAIYYVHFNHIELNKLHALISGIFSVC